MYKFGKDESMKSLPADNIHQRLSDLRNGTGKSQQEVADELNIQASVLSRIERGETKAVSHDLVIKFAEYYNVSTDYLLCISDIRIRRNVELEELGLTNKALLQLLQGNVNGDILSRLLEHRYFPQLLDTINSYFTEEHNAGFANRNAVIDMGTASLRELIKENPDCKIETQHGIREINAQKITGTEADIEKIKSIFLVILKDIKKEFDIPFSDVSSEELQKQLANMRKQALFQKKKNPKFNETNMAKLVMNMFQNMGMDLDEYEQELFQKMMVHMFQRKR
jgi:transcriptional regulator with XRE-family HTH domain